MTILGFCDSIIMDKDEKGDKYAQGIFLKYYLTDDDIAEGQRTGGFGSTGN